MKILIIILLVVLLVEARAAFQKPAAPTAMVAQPTCYDSVADVQRHHPGFRVMWTRRAPGHDDGVCYHPGVAIVQCDDKAPRGVPVAPPRRTPRPIAVPQPQPPLPLQQWRLFEQFQLWQRQQQLRREGF
jgi:hypothetical protein